MLTVSADFASKILSNERKFALRMKIGTTTTLTGAVIQSFSLDEIVNATDVLTFGSACSHKITINLINPPLDLSYNGLEFTAEVGLLLTERPETYEWVSLGKFYGAEASTNNDFQNVTLVAYDGFFKMSGKYNATLTGATTLQAVYNDLKTQLLEKCGITLKARTLPTFSIPSFPQLDLTYTQAVGYVAGCLGEFARFNRSGELEMAWYTDYGLTIDRAQQYMNGFKRTTDKTLTVTSLSTGTQDAPIIKGSGANGIGLNFENPYMTSAMADAIYTKINGFTYTPSSLKWRGNPAVQAGDLIHTFDQDGTPHTLLVMSQNIKLGGGCTGGIECKGKSETTSEFSNNFESTSQKIERVYKTLEKAILDATDKIAGNAGGYVVIHDTNGDSKPDEILIMDKEEIALATKVWRWNKEGLGYSYKAEGGAYNGPYRTAITADGQINADFITTGTLNAERIAVETYNNTTGLLTDYIHFENGTMVFGEGGSSLKLKLENEQIAFYRNDTRIGLFSPNSFELENLTDGKVRFQNFGFIPRPSGNLTFTKLT